MKLLISSCNYNIYIFLLMKRSNLIFFINKLSYIFQENIYAYHVKKYCDSYISYQVCVLITLMRAMTSNATSRLHVLSISFFFQAALALILFSRCPFCFQAVSTICLIALIAALAKGSAIYFSIKLHVPDKKKAASRSTLNPRSASARIGMKWKKEKREREREKDRDTLYTDFLAFLSIHSAGWMIPSRHRLEMLWVPGDFWIIWTKEPSI